MGDKMELGVYIHIPFCIKKCDYCDFISYSDKYEMQNQYINRLIDEIEENKDILQKNRITTIYIGGGTPSSINSKLIKKVLDKIFQIINEKNDDIEITIEVNPGACTYDDLLIYKQSGINRISIGLQSTDDKILKCIGRIHKYQDFKDTYKNVVKAGFDNINVDLMIGLPEQSIKEVKESLNEIVNINPVPKHISVYSLILEEDCKLYNKVNSGNLQLPDEETERNEYKYVKNFLELNGYKHYEISNFAKEGFESKHNVNCWNQKQYIGFGVAAHSYYDKKRYSNTIDFDKYLSCEFTKTRTIHEIQNIDDMMKEYMILGLRMLDGVSILKFKNKFGQNPIYVFRKELEKLVNDDLIIIDLDTIKLTNKGLDFANIVWEEFI